MTQIPDDLYALTEWFQRADGDEALLIRVLANTAGLKGWLARDIHDRLCEGTLSDALSSGEIQAFELAATWLLSQMPSFPGPETPEQWQQWLTSWQKIHKQAGPEQQISLLPERFNRADAEIVLQQLRNQQQQSDISVVQH